MTLSLNHEFAGSIKTAISEPGFDYTGGGIAGLLGKTAESFSRSMARNWPFGAGAGQCNAAWHDRGTLAPAANVSIDLLGANLKTTWQTGITFAAVKGFYLENLAADRDDTLVMYPHIVDGWTQIIKTVGGFLQLRGGGQLCVILADNDLTGYVVTASNKAFVLQNEGSASLDYIISIVGYKP